MPGHRLILLLWDLEKVQGFGVLLMLWLLCRLDAPFGTPDAPVEVPSSFSHRVVGVPGKSPSLLCSGLPECPQQQIEQH